MWLRCYQQPDKATMLSVMWHPRKILDRSREETDPQLTPQFVSKWSVQGSNLRPRGWPTRVTGLWTGLIQQGPSNGSISH